MIEIIDVYSRKIDGWGISNTMSTKWCKNVLEEAIEMHGKSEIVNSGQGRQYISFLWTHYLEHQGIQISMNGKGRKLDNVWIEKFGKYLKYDYIYHYHDDEGIEHYSGVHYHIEYKNQKTNGTTELLPNERYEETIKKAA